MTKIDAVVDMMANQLNICSRFYEIKGKILPAKPCYICKYRKLARCLYYKTAERILKC